MSADNILIIIKKGEVVSIYNVNFSGISSHDDWYPRTAEQRAVIIDYVEKQCARWVIHKAKSVKEAEQWCVGYARREVVEYGHTYIGV